MGLGKIVRELRLRKGKGIKSVAPDLGITYSYLSKIENDEVRPSGQLIDRLAAYFAYDKDRLSLAAGRVPPDLVEILRQHPDDAIALLRERFGARNGNRS